MIITYGLAELTFIKKKFFNQNKYILLTIYNERYIYLTASILYCD